MIKTNAAEYLKNQSENIIVDMNNPLCIDCGECCDLLTMISEEEFKLLKKHLKKEGKEAYRIAKKLYDTRMEVAYSGGTLNLVCPFLDKNKRCRIYSVRPQICKDFHCKKSLAKKDFNKDEYFSGYTIKSLFD